MEASHGGGDPWPEGIRLQKGKMYLNEKLCVPTGLGERVIGAHQLYAGHMGVQRLVREVLYRYKFGFV